MNRKTNNRLSRKERRRMNALRQRCYNILASVDSLRDDEDRVYLFRGAPLPLLNKVFNYLVGNGNGIARGVEILEEHDVRLRNGCSYWRSIVRLHHPNTAFSTQEAQIVLIESVLMRLSRCRIRWVEMDEFLNV